MDLTDCPSMKITLSKPARDALIESREALADALKRCQPTAEKLADVHAQIEALPGEIERLEEKLDPDDDAALIKVATLKTKLLALERQAERISAACDGARLGLRALMLAAQSEIEKISPRIVGVAKTRLAVYLAVIYGTERGALLASDTPQFITLLGFLRCHFTGIVDPESGAAEAIRTLDILISGDLPFIQLPETPELAGA